MNLIDSETSLTLKFGASIIQQSALINYLGIRLFTYKLGKYHPHFKDTMKIKQYNIYCKYQNMGAFRIHTLKSQSTFWRRLLCNYSLPYASLSLGFDFAS